MNSDPCRDDLPRGINLIRQKTSKNRQLEQNGISPSHDQERVDEIVTKWERTGDIPKVKEGFGE